MKDEKQKWLNKGFVVHAEFPGEYTLLFNTTSQELVRVYENGTVWTKSPYTGMYIKEKKK